MLVALIGNAQLIEKITIRTDSVNFTSDQNGINYQGRTHVYFQYDQENEVAEVTLKLSAQAVDYDLKLLSSGDYQLIDSLIQIGSRIRFKVRFNQLSSADFLKFSFQVSEGDFVNIEEVLLLPVHQTYATIYPGNDELYIGEEKTFEVVTNNAENLILDFRWREGENFNYRFSKSGQQVLLHVIPTALGQQYLDLPIKLRKPRRDINGKIIFQTEPLQNEFIVKEGRLVFLQFDRPEITPNDDKKEPISVQIDNHRNLKLGKTYRIEDQEQSGGPLIAELYTKTRLNNDKMLADLRVYAFHRKSEGYLFIKEGDDARFVTNVDITPKTRITSIAIQRDGNAWQPGNTVYPGERVSVRLQGEGLHKSRISFQGVSDLSFDSLVRNENLALFELEIPVNVSNRSIEIFNYNQPTGQSLTVKEYQKARPFDFVKLDLAGEEYVVGDIDRPIYFEKNLTDLVIEFDRSMIDGAGGLHGKQYLTIDVKLSNKAGNLIEIYRFDQVAVCPGESSPRGIYYDRDNCQNDDLNLNNYLTRKTHSLEEWSKIEIEIAHVKDKHGGQGEKKRIQLYLKRDYNFDIDLSFPTGLLILEANSDEFINFGGPSFAMMAQFSFYQEGKIAKYKPYKFGAGFIAIDAFNLTGSGNQDIGMVVMGSLHPTTTGKKLTFPLYAGFGYFLKKQTPFFLLGPGIRVRL